MSLRSALLRFAALLLLVSLLMTGVRAADRAPDRKTPSLEEQFAALAAETAPGYSLVALGYKNTVTGEEHYHNADEYMVGASLYKTPLNMVYAERIGKGELSFDDRLNGWYFRDIQSLSLTYSDNPTSLAMLGDIGDWYGMRKACAEYLGEDAGDEEYLARTNRFSVREMIHCMDLLQRQSERFPGILDCLLLSAPGKFLKINDPSIEIAQKYGNLDEGVIVLNVAGVIYTEQPIAVCVMTQGYTDSPALFSGFVEIVTAYAEETLAAERAEEARLAQEKLEQERLAREEEERAEQERLAREEEERLRAQKQEETRQERKNDAVHLCLCAFGIGVVVLAVLLNKRRRTR